MVLPKIDKFTTSPSLTLAPPPEEDPAPALCSLDCETAFPIAFFESSSFLLASLAFQRLGILIFKASFCLARAIASSIEDFFALDCLAFSISSTSCVATTASSSASLKKLNAALNIEWPMLAPDSRTVATSLVIPSKKDSPNNTSSSVLFTLAGCSEGSAGPSKSRLDLLVALLALLGPFMLNM